MASGDWQGALLIVINDVDGVDGGDPVSLERVVALPDLGMVLHLDAFSGTPPRLSCASVAATPIAQALGREHRDQFDEGIERNVPRECNGLSPPVWPGLHES